MGITKEERLGRIHEEAMKEFDAIQSAMAPVRTLCASDRRFATIPGAQYEGAIGEQMQNRFKIEVNKILMAGNRIEGEYRNNRITVDFVSRTGYEDDELADTLDDLYRADEQDSNADEALDNAFQEALYGGFGAYRLRACKEDEYDDDDDRLRIRFEPIFDADSSVFFDLNAKRQDKSDATRCFVLTSMTADAYDDEYGEQASSLEKTVTTSFFDWFAADVTYIAEYYRVETKSETWRVFVSLTGDEEEFHENEFSDSDLEESLIARGYSEKDPIKRKGRRVHKYIIDGARVIEDCGIIAGRHIPIIPVYGRRWFIDNIERCMGITRPARDPAILKNLQYSKIAEIAALSGISKPIFDPEQMPPQARMMWEKDATENFPYMLAAALRDQNGNIIQTGPLGYTKSPEVPPAVAALITITEQDMQDVLGNLQNADKVVSNISGVAVEQIQQRIDMQSYIYLSNFAKARRRDGVVWLSMSQDSYVEEGRKMRGVTASGKKRVIELKAPTLGDSGESTYKNDLRDADHDVFIEVGPSSDSKRQATISKLSGVLQFVTDPEEARVIISTIMMNMDGEGLNDMRDYYRQKLIRLGAVKPNEEEQKNLEAAAQNQQPDPNAAFLMAEAEKSKATTVKTIAQTEQIKVDTAKTMSEIDANKQDQAIQAAQAIGAALQQNTASAQPVNLGE
jgi:hypothetical protein